MARRGELVALRLEDISFGMDGDGTVTLRTKGGGEHERYLAPEARMAVENWCKAAGIKKKEA
jgi:integrase